MKIIVAIAFIFCIGAYVSWNRHGQEKSHGAAFLSRRSSKPCAKRPSAWKGCSEEEIHRCRLAQQSFAFHSRVFRFRLALRGVLNLDGYLSAFWYFLAFSEGLGLFDLLVIDLLWWRNTKRTRFSFLPEKKYYQNPKKAYRIVLARYPVVCRSRCTVSLDRHGVFEPYIVEGWL